MSETMGDKLRQKCAAKKHCGGSQHFENMNHFIIYWTRRGYNPASVGTPLLYAGSNQFDRVSADDCLYSITYADGHFYFVGRIIVSRIVGKREAASSLATSPNSLWDARLYALADHTQATAAVHHLCDNLLHQISVVVRGNPQPLTGAITPQRFQTMRLITPGSAHLFDALLA